MIQAERVFSKNSDAFTALINKQNISHSKLGVRSFDNAYIIPPCMNRIIPWTKDVFHGGVCDENMAFVAGSAVNPKRYCDNKSFIIKADELENSNETVVFGGVFYRHFGIMLIFSLSRLWWLVENTNTAYKIAFLIQPIDESVVRGYCEQIMEILGIPKERYLIVTNATRFARVIIPDETVSENAKQLHWQYGKALQKLKKMALMRFGYSDKEKIYLSRRRYARANSNCDGVNEEYYENFYMKRGYHVIHTQELPLSKQISYIAGASKIVSTYGTLAHLVTIFADENAKQVMLLKTDYIDEWFWVEASLLRLFSLDWYIVESTKNPYPTIHDGGAFLYYPTEYFKCYLDTLKEPYEASELQIEISSTQMEEYLKRWVEVYSKSYFFRKLKRPDLFPILQSLYYGYYGKELEMSNYIEG